MVVVVLGVTNADKEDDEVDDGYRTQLAWCSWIDVRDVGVRRTLD